MIATNIDGSAMNGSNQLLDLLTLVANPDAYAQKVSALEELIAKNQKYVEMVGPASDILALREEARADRLAAKLAITEAKCKADGIIVKADAKAKEIAAAAREAADALAIETETANTAAKANAAAAISAEKAAKSAATQSKKLSTELQAQVAEAILEKEKATAAAVDAEQVKKDILAKHQAFIDSFREG
jgi:hypothetical protein